MSGNGASFSSCSSIIYFFAAHSACCIRIGRDSMLYSVFFLLAPVAYATFSVRVADRHSGMVHTAHNHFPGAMKAEHVADLYARVSGKAPLLKEGTIMLLFILLGCIKTLSVEWLLLQKL